MPQNKRDMRRVSVPRGDDEADFDSRTVSVERKSARSSSSRGYPRSTVLNQGVVKSRTGESLNFFFFLFSPLFSGTKTPFRFFDASGIAAPAETEL